MLYTNAAGTATSAPTHDYSQLVDLPRLTALTVTDERDGTLLYDSAAPNPLTLATHFYQWLVDHWIDVNDGNYRTTRDALDTEHEGNNTVDALLAIAFGDEASNYLEIRHRTYEMDLGE